MSTPEFPKNRWMMECCFRHVSKCRCVDCVNGTSRRRACILCFIEKFSEWIKARRDPAGKP